MLQWMPVRAGTSSLRAWMQFAALPTPNWFQGTNGDSNVPLSGQCGVAASLHAAYRLAGSPAEPDLHLSKVLRAHPD